MESNMTDTNPSEYCSFEQLQALANQFEAALKELGITFGTESPLSKIVSEVTSLPAKREQLGRTPEPKDVRPMWRDILTVRRFALKFLRLYQREGFSVLMEHLTHLDEGKFSQNQQDRSEIGNKMFELWIALLSFETGVDLAIDPFNAKKSTSGQKNADVLVTYKGIRWAIECKVPGGSFESVLNRFDDAVEQIEASSATKGIVMISARNLIAHDAFWKQHADQSYHSWDSDEEARRRLWEEANNFASKLRAVRTPERWDEVLAGKKTIPILGGVFQSACSIQRFGQPTVTDYCLMTATKLGTDQGEIHEVRSAFELLEAFNEAMHDRFVAA
jgi:hypothetical protein